MAASLASMAKQADPGGSDTDDDAASALFWDLAQEWLARPGVERSTMMGFPCLRRDGVFFACVGRRNGDLIIKLSADRVAAHIADGHGAAFAPNGRTFKEWVAFPERDEARWREVLEEAYEFSGGSGGG